MFVFVLLSLLRAVVDGFIGMHLRYTVVVVEGSFLLFTVMTYRSTDCDQPERDSIAGVAWIYSPSFSSPIKKKQQSHRPNLKRQNYLADTFFSGCSLFCSRTTTKTTPNQNNKEQQNNKTAFGHSLHKLQQRGATTNINKS
jgi:hypothetical protein